MSVRSNATGGPQASALVPGLQALVAAAAVICAATSYLVYFAYTATLDAAYADYLLPPFVDAVDACVGGHNCLSALLAPSLNGYRWVVPSALLALNAAWLGLNTRVELTLGLFGLALSSFILYFWLARAWVKTAQPFALVAVWAPSVFFLFNLNQWENIVLGIGGYHLLGNAALLLCLWVVDRSLRSDQPDGRQATALFAALVLSSVFLLQYFVVLAGTCLVLFVATIVFGRRPARPIVFAALLGSIAGLALTFVPGAAIGTPQTTLPTLGDLRSIALFLLNMWAAGMVQWEGWHSIGSSVAWLGVSALLGVTLAIWLFVRRDMQRTSWLPLALCLYSLLGSVLIAISRFRYGIDYGYSSRYTSQTILGLIGCYLIVAKAIADGPRNSAAMLVTAVFCIAVAGLQVSTHFAQWQVAPYRYDYYRAVIEAAAKYERATDAEIALFQVPPPLARRGLGIFHRHRIAFFRGN